MSVSDEYKCLELFLSYDELVYLCRLLEKDKNNSKDKNEKLNKHLLKEFTFLRMAFKMM